VEEIFQDTINWEDAIGMKANQVMGYLAVSLAGAAVGGIVVAGMTRAIPNKKFKHLAEKSGISANGQRSWRL
jgi:hypothetical protein